MERSQLDAGDWVAVYPLTPVPADLYSDFVAQSIIASVVTDPKPESGGVEVNTANRGVERFQSRQVIARWDDYVERRALRVDANRSDAERRTQRLASEARILAAARTRWPNAAIVGDALVIPLDDWVNAHGALPSSSSSHTESS